MSYFQIIRSASTDAEKLEQVYQEAVTVDAADSFKKAIDTSYAEQPGNLLYAAWYFRLAAMVHSSAMRRAVVWSLAVPLALANGILYWWLSDSDQFAVQIVGRSSVPYILLLWAPLAAFFLLAYLTGAGRRSWLPMASATAMLAALSAYPFCSINYWTYRSNKNTTSC